MATNNNIVRNDVIMLLADKLKTFDFEKKVNTFIREPEKGLYQVIELSLGQSSSITANHIGLGFGVATEEWIEILNISKRPKTISSADCEIRDCYCDFYSNSDLNWIKITGKPSELTQIIYYRINSLILPFLNKVKTRQSIINMWKINHKNVGLPPRHALSIGILMYTHGQIQEGKSILDQLYKENSKNSFYTNVIDKIIKT
jgi:hypothetical protein